MIKENKQGKIMQIKERLSKANLVPDSADRTNCLIRSKLCLI